MRPVSVPFVEDVQTMSISNTVTNKTPRRVRDNFVETWLWTDLFVG